MENSNPISAFSISASQPKPKHLVIPISLFPYFTGIFSVAGRTPDADTVKVI